MAAQNIQVLTQQFLNDLVTAGLVIDPIPNQNELQNLRRAEQNITMDVLFESALLRIQTTYDGLPRDLQIRFIPDDEYTIFNKMIAIAKGKANAKDVKNVTFEQMTIDGFDAPRDTYDAVMGLSILHLLNNKDEVIAKVYNILKPQGMFVTSTICMGDTMKYAKFIAPIGRLLGLVLRVFTTDELKKSFTDAGFLIDYEWKPSKGKATFIVAKKPG